MALHDTTQLPHIPHARGRLYSAPSTLHLIWLLIHDTAVQMEISTNGILSSCSGPGLFRYYELISAAN